MAHRGKTQYVVVADDQLLFRSGVRTLLSAEGDMQVVAEASSLAEVLLKREQIEPDVIVLSSSLLRASSSAEWEQVRAWAEGRALVLITDSDDVTANDVTQRIGSHLSIPRSTAAAQMVATIRQAAWREEQDASGMSRTAAGLTALAKAHSAKTKVLTSREQEVVKLLAEGRTVRETAAELSLSAKTIDAHKLNVMRKLDIHNRETLIQYAISQRIVTPLSA